MGTCLKDLILLIPYAMNELSGVVYSMDGQTFGQRQPPLYVAIQKILDKYPDGQIFKVQFF